MKERTRNMMFASLFIMASYSTVTNISNVSITDLDDWLSLNNRIQDSAIGVSGKSLGGNNDPKSTISTDAAPGTLTEALDLTNYPTTTVIATGYTAGMESTGKTPEHPEYGITYSGVPVKRDLYSTIAADLTVYPIGTVLYIPDYGYGVVADKGAAIQGNKLDLYFPTVEDVYQHWGKKTVEVYVIKEGDGTLSEADLDQWNDNEALKVFRTEILAQ